MGVSFGSISKPTQADRRGSVLATHEPVQVGTPLRSVSEKLHSVQGAHPLRRSAAIPLTSLHRFLPAGHAKHGATPSGVFGWTQSGQSGAWGYPNKLHGDIENDIPMPCLPTLSEFPIAYNLSGVPDYRVSALPQIKSWGLSLAPREVPGFWSSHPIACSTRYL